MGKPTRPLALVTALAAVAVAAAVALYARREPAPRPGMTWVPAGEFRMGNDAPDAPPEETPAHDVRLDGYWIDDLEVTNTQFDAFARATGYVTTAERAPDWEELRQTLPTGTPKPPESSLVAGSLVFAAPGRRVAPDDPAGWWRWVPGACWRHPEGPGSDLKGRGDHPVVQVSWNDAAAYAAWAGKRLPREAEWERAARGNLDGRRFTWGDEPIAEGGRVANVWQGEFPVNDTAADGHRGTAPVGSYPPNGFGLYDMAGNVWEWCADRYRADAYALADVADNPRGPPTSWDPAEPDSPKRVTRGGSFLCHASYCESYRPAARRGTAPDTGLSHLGFRCAASR